jgi:hypothetical protein
MPIAVPRVGVERPNGSYVARTFSVGRAIFQRSQTNVTGCIVALTEHRLHVYEVVGEENLTRFVFTHLFVRRNEIFNRVPRRIGDFIPRRLCIAQSI